MSYFKKLQKYKIKKSYFELSLHFNWFVPSDVLQRGIEANIWDLCTFKEPVLDIGVGNGEISKIIFKNHPQMAVGIDIDKSGLEQAKKSKRYKRVLCVNAEKMPFKDQAFYTVVSNSTFEHIKHDIQAVGEVSRVLKKNGLFYITVPSNFLQEWVFEYELKQDSVAAKQKLIKFNKRTNHLHYRNLLDWQKIFSKNDMEIIFYKYYFPHKVAISWYIWFKRATYQVRNKELWYWASQSRFTNLLPKALIKRLLRQSLFRVYKNGYLTDENGAQLFMIARKK